MAVHRSAYVHVLVGSARAVCAIRLRPCADSTDETASSDVAWLAVVLSMDRVVRNIGVCLTRLMSMRMLAWSLAVGVNGGMVYGIWVVLPVKKNGLNK